MRPQLGGRHDGIMCSWVAPAIGFLVIGFVLWNAASAANIGRLVWLAIGVVVLLYNNMKHIGILPEHAADPAAAGSDPDRDPFIVDHRS